jgi:hypothetical protein
MDPSRCHTSSRAAPPTQPLLLSRSTDPHLVYVSTYFYLDTIKAVPDPGSERNRLIATIGFPTKQERKV